MTDDEIVEKSDETAVPPVAGTAQIPVSEPMVATAESLPPAPSTPVATSPSFGRTARDLWAKALAAIQTKKQKRLAAIMKYLDRMDKHGRITNDEVEKLLHVSDATATRYLAQLEKEAKIKKIGTEGAAVYYI